MNKTRRQRILEQRESYKLTSTEMKVSLLIAKFIVVILAILAYTLRAIVITLFKLKRWLFRIAIVILITHSAFSTLTQITYAPYAHATEFKRIEKPLTEKEQIINYVFDRFGKDAEDALAVFKCESGLRANAIGHNTNGSTDYGVAQINSIHQVNGNYLLDYRTNIDIAYQIFSEQSWRPWTCSRVLNK